MRSGSIVASIAVPAIVLAVLAPGCETKEPETRTYFQQTIGPVLQTSCVRTNTGAGCHVADAKGNAFGNLDVSSFEGVGRRRDLLTDYGAYGQPAFLLKNVPPYQVQVQMFDGTRVVVTTDIKHAGGPILDPTASGYQILRRWIENGATENNGGAPPPNYTRLPCTAEVPSGVAGFDPSVDPPGADYGTFRDRANPTLGRTCAAANCHGTLANDLYLTCGDTPEQTRWNYFAASEYLASVPEQSEILRRPLAPSQGGAYHEGGTIFASTGDDAYQGFLQWARDHGPPQLGTLEPGFDFFAHKVQPMLVKKGCMMLQCHSSAMFHDYRLRGGSGGSFSLSASRRNYDLTIHQLSIESEDPGASRLVRKNLYRPEVFPGAVGIAHRGGPLLEDFQGQPATPALCDATPFDYDNGNLDTIPAYCVIREWLRRERTARNLSPLSAVVYVQRDVPSGPDRLQDFDVYAPGADLRISKATLSITGDVTTSDDASVTAGCGLDPSTADIRRPAVSWDGKQVAFAARGSAGEPLQIYVMNADGSACAKQADINAKPAQPDNGILIHNFDPAWSPPDGAGHSHIVFASTRGNNLPDDAFDYHGAQHTPADPTKPNANLYVLEPSPIDPSQNRIRQLTYLLNMERAPSFMQDGRIIFTTEKRAPGFYQLALRRMNLDGGDYHPLFAQRGSIGYKQATDVVELADKNFAAIFSDPGAPHGGGTLGVFNRSLGIDFTSQDPNDYPIDPSVIDPAAPASPDPAFFLHSLRFPDPGASGHLGPTSGLYRSPSPLPGGKLLVSFGTAGDVASFGGDYDVYVLDPITGAKTKLLGAAGKADVDAVAVFARPDKGIFASALDEPNGHTRVYDGRTEADVTVLDMPVLASLLFQNTPTGRLVEDGIPAFDIYEDMPPVNAGSDGGGFFADNVAPAPLDKVYVRRRSIGRVGIQDDGSTHFQIPGGMPIVLKLADSGVSREHGIPRFQREEMMFVPGEYVHQSFKKEFFNGLCGQCHGAISGQAVDVAVRPDVLTQASDTKARASVPINLVNGPGDRGAIEGPPQAP